MPARSKAGGKRGWYERARPQPVPWCGKHPLGGVWGAPWGSGAQAELAKGLHLPAGRGQGDTCAASHRARENWNKSQLNVLVLAPAQRDVIMLVAPGPCSTPQPEATP